MVTGGVIYNGTDPVDTVTTELSINEGVWSTVLTGDLPTPRHALRGISLNNNVFMTGEKINFKIYFIKPFYVISCLFLSEKFEGSSMCRTFHIL